MPDEVYDPEMDGFTSGGGIDTISKEFSAVREWLGLEDVEEVERDYEDKRSYLRFLFHMQQCHDGAYDDPNDPDHFGSEVRGKLRYYAKVHNLTVPEGEMDEIPYNGG